MPRMTAQELPGVESRQRILDAATHLMSERGYSGTSISMITKLSGLPASSTYWHFGSKERLLAEVLESAAMTWLRSLPRWTDLKGDPRQRFAQMLEVGATDWSGGRPAFLRLMFMIALEQGDARGEILETIRRVRAQVKRTFRHAFVEAYGEPKDKRTREFADRLVTFALALVDGLFLATQIEGDAIDEVAQYNMLEPAFFALADQYAAAKDARPPARRRAR
jgi:AcrR family transcriptional regulator